MPRYPGSNPSRNTTMQYKITVPWSTSLVNVQFLPTLLPGNALNEAAFSAVKITTGAPSTGETNGRFMPSALIYNAISGVLYKNAGSLASNSWAIVDTSTGGLPALADGDIWVGNASNVATAVAVSGDITLSNAGVAAIGAGKVLKAMLGTGIKANFMTMFLDDSYTTTGGAAAEVIPVVGAVAGDKVIVSLYDNGTANVSIVSAVAGTDQITVTFSADPGNDTIIAYEVLRATS